MKNPQPFVGIYRCGVSNIELYGLTHDHGGCFYVQPDNKSMPRMKVGLAYDYWWEVVNVLMHESFEYLAVQRNLRMIPCGNHTNASDVYRFHLDHNDMTQLIADQAYFLTKCLPDLARVWKKHRPKHT